MTKLGYHYVNLWSQSTSDLIVVAIVVLIIVAIVVPIVVGLDR
jgi:hypothetical protein